MRCSRPGYGGLLSLPQAKVAPFHGYVCGGDYLTGGVECGRTPGYHLDRAVREAVLAKISPPSVESLREQWQQAKNVALSSERRLALEVDRARREVAAAKHRALAVDPELVGVSKELNQMWEDAKTRLRKLESQQDPEPTAMDFFTPESWAEVIELAANVDTIWDAETTEDRDIRSSFAC